MTGTLSIKRILRAVGIAFTIAACGPTTSPSCTSSSQPGITTIFKSSSTPQFEVGKEIEAPDDVTVTPWEPSEKCRALADTYIRKMTVAQKAGQMVQISIRHLKDKADLATYGIGSMLAGGSDYPPGALTADSWAAYTAEVKTAAMKNAHGIPLLFAIDAVHGNAKTEGAVVFPHNVGLGCTGDEKLLEEIGRITALETLGSGVDWAFSPVLAAARDERWGRTYEAFGETPEIAATLGTALIRGIQRTTNPHASIGALACAKHFAGDGATTFGTSHMDGGFLDRGNTTLPDDQFWKLAVSQYIPAIEAGVGSIMVSYSSVNGRKMHGEKNLLTNILKGTLGFNGFVISDWKGIDDLEGDFQADVITAINAGIDVIMAPDDFKEFIEVVTDAVPAQISQERIDDAVQRILQVKCEMGLFEDTYSPTTDPALIEATGNSAHRNVAREAVAKSLVLLKNDGAILPLKKDARVHIAGSGADNLDKQCGGWTMNWGGAGSKTKGTTVLEAITHVVGKQNVSTSKDATGIPADTTVGVVVVGEYPYAEWLGDRDRLTLDDDDVDAIANMKKTGIPFVVILFSGRPMIITDQLNASNAFIAAWLPGTEGDGIADILFGDVPATGKLSHSWPKGMNQIPINAGDKNYAPLFPLGYGLTTAETTSQETVQ